MKKILVLFVVLITTVAHQKTFAQDTFPELIIGSWQYVDANGTPVNLEITDKTWTYKNTYVTETGKGSKTQQITTTYNYRFINKKKVFLYFEEEHPENAYVKIAELDENTLVLKGRYISGRVTYSRVN